MKLTDKKVIEALKAGKQIKDTHGNLYKLNKSNIVCDAGTGDMLVMGIRALSTDFEIVGPEIDWDKVIKEKYLCRFWNRGDDPLKRIHFGTLTRIAGDSFFVDQEMNYWNSCRPLRTDEVKLVTDEKELWK